MNRIVRIFLTVWVGSLCGLFPVEAAVDFRAGVNRDTITVGDPIIFRMRLLRDAGDVTTFDWADTFPSPFEVVEKRPVLSVTQDDGKIQETTDVVMTIFQVGAFEIPSIDLRYVLANGDSGRVSSRHIPVVIQSVKLASDIDIRDVKPPVQIEAQVPLWAWLVLGGGLGGVCLLVWWMYKRKKKPVSMPAPPPKDWLAELRKIEKLELVDQGKYKAYYSLLSDILRRCIEAKTPIRAVEETTFEITRDLRLEGEDDAFVQEIESFLLQADMVKFAKFTPQPDVVQRALPQVEVIVKVLVRSKSKAISDGENGVAS